MKKKIAPFVENITESTTACLVTMVQGNLLALSLSHWVIASQTGILAGAVTSVAVLYLKPDRLWLIAVLLGVITAIVDFFVHPGMFESVVLEALITGLAAAALSYLVGSLVRYFRASARSR